MYAHIRVTHTTSPANVDLADVGVIDPGKLQANNVLFVFEPRLIILNNVPSAFNSTYVYEKSPCLFIYHFLVCIKCTER